MSETSPEFNRNKIRGGFIVVGLVMLVALVLFIAISNAAGRAVFALVFVFGAYRLYKLVRSLR